MNMDSDELEDSFLDSKLLGEMMADTFAQRQERKTEAIPADELIEQFSPKLQPLLSDIEWFFQRHVNPDATIDSNVLEVLMFHQFKKRSVSHESIAELGDHALSFLQCSQRTQAPQFRNFAESVFQLFARLAQVPLKSIAHSFPYEHVADEVSFIQWKFQTSCHENIMLLLPASLAESLDKTSQICITIGECPMTLEEWQKVEAGTVIRLNQKLNATLSAVCEGEQISGKLGKVGRHYAFRVETSE